MSQPPSFDNLLKGTLPPNTPSGSEPDVELLVAYLDGELDAQGVRQMEDRLSVEPDLREKMVSLEQTWNMLDQLETVPVDKELVRSTMEVVTLTIEKELGEDEKRLEKRKLFDRLITVAILFMFGVIGYQLAMLGQLNRNKEILEDIPIIQRMSMYKEIDSIEFLKKLSEKGVFDPPKTEAATTGDVNLSENRELIGGENRP